MPQLAIETYFTQYFWLIVILLTFYYLLATKILPEIAEILKTRKKIDSITVTTSTVSENQLNNKINTLFSEIITVPTTTTRKSKITFKTVRRNWINSVLK